MHRPSKTLKVKLFSSESFPNDIIMIFFIPGVTYTIYGKLNVNEKREDCGADVNITVFVLG